MRLVDRLLGRRAGGPAADASPRRGSRLAGIAAATSAAALGAVLFLAPGTSGAYTAAITNTNNTAASSAAYFTCTSALAADRADALFAYAFTEAAGSSRATDIDSGAYPGTYRGSMRTTTTSPQACPRDSGSSYLLDGSSSQVTNGLQQNAPAAFSTELWFKTTVKGGKLIGFGDSQTGLSGSYDRHTYVNTAGQLVFGVYTQAAGIMTVTSPGVVTDGAWHHVVSTMSPTAGMTLWLDGVAVAANSTYRTAESTTGWWRIGYDNLDTWPGAGSRYFAGSMRFAAVYSTALTGQQVRNHYNAGR
ncbi:LamG domain-containing protein [Clavibacter sepedonicus]|uniref:Exported protein n=1 Tax=Clavibacter sepedonicus TaxID=31964 RepID=B0RBH3_CLASE|nr:LamG domain-containing protein [Clavibacter sepedonicus]OQJ48395.1 signal peptidase I [Clavibacter sepedonicus]OQJ53877.1 signal peptidase I [Clavibacter sepedonicus]UUK65391.1 LamG domain-containing protein [Clavibacter sepedonicus]CAQ02869.1 putative exported protein [Clavibacter sepedonicus]